MTKEEAAYYEANKRVRAHVGPAPSPEWTRLLGEADWAREAWETKRSQLRAQQAAAATCPRCGHRFSA